MLYFRDLLASVFGIQDFETVKWNFLIYRNKIIKSGMNTICWNRSMTAEIPEFLTELS